MKTFDSYILEASVNHFVNRMQKGLPILAVSASRHENSKELNEKNNKTLRSIIRKAGYGFNRVVGFYKEKQQDEDGNDVEVLSQDDTCLVYCSKSDEKALFKLGMMLGEKFQQDSILFIGETITNGKPVLFSTSEHGTIGGIGSRHTLGAFHYNTPSDVVTVIRGKSYHFDWEEEQPAKSSSTMNEALVRKAFKDYILEHKDFNDWNLPL